MNYTPLKTRLINGWRNAMEDSEAFAALLMNLYIGFFLLVGAGAMIFQVFRIATGVAYQ